MGLENRWKGGKALESRRHMVERCSNEVASYHVQRAWVALNPPQRGRMCATGNLQSRKVSDMGMRSFWKQHLQHAFCCCHTSCDATFSGHSTSPQVVCLSRSDLCRASDSVSQHGLLSNATLNVYMKDNHIQKRTEALPDAGMRGAFCLRAPHVAQASQAILRFPHLWFMDAP